MNVATLLGDVLKCRHMESGYKYLVQGQHLFFVLHYMDDDETPIDKRAFIGLNDAKKYYNHIEE